MKMDTKVATQFKFSKSTEGLVITQLLPFVRKACVTLLSACVVITSYAGPRDGQISSGQGVIDNSRNDTTIIRQHSDRLSIDWRSFNVAHNERVIFQQPSANATALNRIFDQNPSQIFGAIDANGRILLINPNGILFGESARINIQSLVASSLELSLDDFKTGNYDLRALADSHGARIINRGEITAGPGGSVSLIGDSVSNEGIILADYGQVNLASGRQATINFEGDGMLLFAVGEPVADNPDEVASAVSNQGQIIADGGQVLLAANAARDVFSSVVNNEGSIRATRIDNSGGVIRLVANTGNDSIVSNSGVLDVSSSDGEGGLIQISGDKTAVLGEASLNASGVHGGGTIHVGGGVQGNDSSINNADYTYVGSQTSIRADATVRGDGGEVAIWSDQATHVHGEVSARGGVLGGDGGFIETSSKGGLVVTDAPNVSASRGEGGEWLIDPIDLDIIPGGGNDIVFEDANTSAPDTIFTSMTANSSNGSGAAELGVDLIIDALQSGDVTLLTGPGAGNGDITLTAGTALDYNDTGVGGTLTFMADGNIVIAGSILDGDNDITDTLNLVLNAVSGNISIGATASIMLNGGAFASSSNNFENNGSVVASAFDIDVGVQNAGSDNVIGDLISTGVVSLQGGSINSVMGGAGNDTFDFDMVFDGDVFGGGGNDIFNFNTGGDVTGVVVGNAGNDIFNFDSGGAITATSISGNEDDDTFNLLSGTLPNGIVGGAGDDTLVGPNDENDWIITAIAVGVATGTLNGNTFTQIEILEGGAGTGANIDTLFGPDDPNLWEITAQNAGDLDGVEFSAIESLVGGTDTDGFTLNGGTLTGSINGGGGAGINTLTADSISAENDWVIDNPDSGTLTGIGDVFSNIANLVGGTIRDVFTFTSTVSGDVSGRDGNDEFNLNAGSDVAGALSGNVGVDTFNFNTGGNVTGTISGNAGNDVFTFDSGGAITATSINGNEDNDSFNLVSGTVTNGFIGGDGTDVLTGPDSTNTWMVSSSLTNDGSQNNNAFFGIESLVGGAGADTLIGPDDPSLWQITSENGGILNGDLFSNIESLVGGIAPDEFTLNGGTLTGSIDGGAVDFNTLTADSIGAENAWVIDNPDSGTLTGIGGVFSNIANLVGGTIRDVFTFTSTVSGDVSGDSGNDEFNLNASSDVVGSLSGNVGVDTFNFNAGGNVTGAVSGNAGNDVFNFDSGGAITATSINGNEDNDSFNLISGTLTNGIIGGDGTDMLTGPDGDNDWVVLSSLTNDGTLNDDAFFGIESLVGGDGADTLFGPDDPGIWLILSENGGLLNDDPFSNIESLVGGDATDEFTLNGGTLTGSINGGGGAGINTLTADSISAENDWVIDNPDSGTLTGIGDVFSNIANLVGGTIRDVFTFTSTVSGDVSGRDGNDEFNLNAGSDVAGALSGNVGVDTFNFNTGGNVTGTISGNAGNDVFTFDSGGAITATSINGNEDNDSFNLVSGTVTNGFIGGDGTDVLTGPDSTNTWMVSSSLTNDGSLNNNAFFGIESLVGGAGADTLIGPDDPSLWQITSENGGILNGDLFSNIESLVGGIAPDEFTLNGGTLTGSIDGGAVDFNTLTADSIGAENAWVIDNPDSGTLTGIGGVFSNIANLVGGTIRDVFTFTSTVSGDVSGDSGNDAFNITGAGDVAGSLLGDAGNDVFTFNGLNFFTATTVSGGFGDDQFNFVSGTVNAVVSGDQDADSFNLLGGSLIEVNGGTGIDTLTGDDFDLIWSIDGAGSGDAGGVFFSELENLTGGAGNDTFELINGGSVSLIDGGANGEGDVLFAGNNPNTWNVTGLNGGDVGGQDFEGIEILTGGTDVDTFNFVGNLNDDLAGILSGTANGGDGDDVFNLIGRGTAAQMIGGAGINSLNAGNIMNTWIVDVANGGTLNGNSFSDIENYVGGTAVDNFTVSSTISGQVDGNLGDDEFIISGAIAGDLSGNDGDDDVTITETGVVSGNVFGNGDDDVFIVAGAIEGSLSGNDGDDEFDVTGVITGDLLGNSGNDSFAINGEIAGLIDGGSTDNETNTLQGANENTTWTVDTQGNLTISNVNDVEAANINSYIGGTGVDTFNIEGIYDGDLDGGDGDDVFNLLMGGSATNLLGNDGIDTINGFDGEDNIWTIDGIDSGSVNGQDFEGIENLNGGMLDDQFTIGLDGFVSGVINGMNGTNTLTAEDQNDWVLTGLDAGNLGDVVGGFVNISEVFGGAETDTFLVSGAFGGNVSGGDGDDEFTLQAAGSVANIDGGEGINALTAASAENTWMINTATGGLVDGVTSAFVNISDVFGGAMADTFNVVAEFLGNISGGAGSDIYNIAVNGDVAGNLAGQAGDDVFNFDNEATVTAMSISGGQDNDTFNFNSGTVVTEISGDAGLDTFDFSGGGLAASIFGGSDVDELIASDMANMWIVTADNEGTLNTVAFSEFENLTGGAGVDEFTINGSISGIVNGGDGMDQFTLNQDSSVNVDGGIFGGGDDDQLVVSIVDGERTVSFEGGEGNDSLLVSGGDESFTTEINADTGLLSFTSSGGNTQVFDFTQVEDIEDTVSSSDLTISVATMLDIILSEGGTDGTDPLLAALGFDYDFSNKINVALSAPMAGLMVDGDIGVAGELTIETNSLAITDGTISATDLIVTGAEIDGLVMTNITNLSLNAVSGMFIIDEANDLNLLSSTAEGSATIMSEGELQVAAGETINAGNLTLSSMGSPVSILGTVNGAAVSIDGSQLNLFGVVSGSTSIDLNSDSTIDQDGSGSLETAMFTSESVEGLTLDGQNMLGGIIATNTNGAMLISNSAAATATLDNNGGAMTIMNTGNLTVTALENEGGNTVVNVTGDLGLAGDVETTSQETSLSATGELSQDGTIEASGNLTISGDEIVAAATATSSSNNANVVYMADGDITVNDVTAENGSITLTSNSGDILAARAESELTSDNITFSGIGRVGTAITPFKVQSNADQALLTLDSPNGMNPGLDLFINEFGSFVSVGIRSLDTIDQRFLSSSSVFGQSLSATLGLGADFDSSIFDDDPDPVVPIGRGVSIPCTQVADEEEVCQ